MVEWLEVKVLYHPDYGTRFIPERKWLSNCGFHVHAHYFQCFLVDDIIGGVCGELFRKASSAEQRGTKDVEEIFIDGEVDEKGLRGRVFALPLHANGSVGELRGQIRNNCKVACKGVCFQRCAEGLVLAPQVAVHRCVHEIFPVKSQVAVLNES